MSIAITEDHQSLAKTADDFLHRRDARGSARALLEAPDEAPALLVGRAHRARLARAARPRGAGRFGLRARGARRRDRAARQCSRAGSVRADGDRQRGAHRGRRCDRRRAAARPRGWLGEGRGRARGVGHRLRRHRVGQRRQRPRRRARRRAPRRGGRRRRRGEAGRRCEGRRAAEHGPDPPLRAGDARRRAGHGAPGRTPRARRPRPRALVRRGSRPRARVHRDGGFVREGAPAVRPPDRDVPSGEAPLRQHGRRQ